MNLFATAGLLLLFARPSYAGPKPMILIVLASLSVGAALLLQSGVAGGRLVGLATAGTTAGYSVFCLWTGRGAVPGGVLAIYVFIGLISPPKDVKAAMTGFPGGYAVPPQFSPPQQWVPAQPQAWPPDAWPPLVRQPPAPPPVPADR